MLRLGVEEGEVTSDMSRGDGQTWPGLAVAAVVGAVLAGGALWGIACAVIVIIRPPGELFHAGVAVVVGAGFALIALSLCLILRRLGVMDGGDGADGDDWGREEHDPNRPQPSSDGPDVWPEFERELREYLEQHERTPVAG